MLAVAKVIDRSTTFLLTLLIASKLGASGVGTYATALAFYGVILIAGEAGSTMFLIRELSKDKSRTGPYLMHLSTLALGICVVLTIGAEVVVRHIGYTHAVQDSVAVVLLAIFPKTLNTIQEAVFVVHGRTELETITTGISSAVILGLSIWLLETGHGVVSVVIVLVSVEYVVTLVYYVLIQRSIARLRWHFDWPFARGLIDEIKSFTGSSLLAALFARPEIIILSLMSSPAEVGYYSAAVRVSEIWLFVPVVFMNNVFPLLTQAFQEGEQRFREVQFKAIRYTMAYCLPLSVGMVALAKPIINTLFGHKFHSSVLELQLLAANLTLYTLMGILWRSVSARGRQGTVFRVQLVITAVRIATGVGLIAPLASLGAAISATLSSGLHVVLLEQVVRRGGAPARVLKASWRVALACVPMGALSWLLVHWLSIWIVIPIAAGVFLAGIVLLRAIPADDLELLRSMLPARIGGRSIRRTAAEAHREPAPVSELAVADDPREPEGKPV